MTTTTAPHTFDVVDVEFTARCIETVVEDIENRYLGYAAAMPRDPRLHVLEAAVMTLLRGVAARYRFDPATGNYISGGGWS